MLKRSKRQPEKLDANIVLKLRPDIGDSLWLVAY